jgi:hypothetical protein
MQIEDAVTYKEIAQGAFLDIEGTFDRTSFDVFQKLLNEMGWSPPL